MFVSIDDFVASVDESFWKAITTQSAFKDVISFQDVDRKIFLINLAKQLNKYEHAFPPPDYYYIPKGHGILRKLKVYSLEDNAIYYFCVKAIQSNLVGKIKENQFVFGGFRFTPDLKLSDEDLESIAYDPKYEGLFAKYQFRKEWGEYQRLAHSLAQRNYKCYVHADIAHFYDDVNLSLLEDKVRGTVTDKNDILNLLFYFLRFSDKHDLGFLESTVGLPQEEVGEMSRLLANFYLNTFDTGILKRLDRLFPDSDYFYTRYADDLWFCFNGDENDAKRVVQEVALELGKIKLHLNEGKILVFDKEKFVDYWMFDEWEQLLNNKSNPAYAYALYNQIILNPNNNTRWFSIANYALKVATGKITNLSLITNEAQAVNLLRSVIINAKMLPKLSPEQNNFFTALVEKYPSVRVLLCNYIGERENVYPNVTIFILELLSATLEKFDNVDLLQFMFDCYFELHSPSQWYLRCLCIKAFIVQMDYLEKQERQKLMKIIKHIGNSEPNLTYRERRYCIRFLSYLRDNRGTDILEERFIQPEDLAFRKYLSGTK